MTQYVNHGKILSGDTARAPVDFGKAVLMNKKGHTGIKVWIAYGN